MFKAIREQITYLYKEKRQPLLLASVHSSTQGNPRLSDNLMTDALAIGSQQDKRVMMLR